MEVNRKITEKEAEDFMHKDSEVFQDMIIKMRILYENWDMVNDDDDIMLDHLQEVLTFFGVKKITK